MTRYLSPHLWLVSLGALLRLHNLHQVLQHAHHRKWSAKHVACLLRLCGSSSGSMITDALLMLGAQCQRTEGHFCSQCLGFALQYAMHTCVTANARCRVVRRYHLGAALGHGHQRRLRGL